MVRRSFYDVIDGTLMPKLTPDLRIWNNFYSRWMPFDPVERVEVSKRADLQVDTMTIVLPTPHRLDKQLLESRVKGRPVTLHINGVWWTGQITQAKKTHENGTARWTITVSSDEKHLWRLAAKTPITGAARPVVPFKGTLGASMRYMIGEAVERTGLPVYLTGDEDGPEVELAIRTEDYIGSILDPALEASPMLAEVRTIYPDSWRIDPNPGGKRMYQYAGHTERQFFAEATRTGVYGPQVESSAKIVPTPIGNPYVPPFWHKNPHPEATGYIDLRGRSTSDGGELVWRQFEPPNPSLRLAIRPPTLPKDQGIEVDPNQHFRRETRVARWEDLRLLTWRDQRKRWFGTHVTYWESGTFGKYKLPNEIVWERFATDTNSVFYLKGGQLYPFDRYKQDSIDYFGGFPSPHNVYCWWDGKRYILAKEDEWETVANPRIHTQQNQPMPGLMIRLMQERDRTRQVVFTTSEGGGLDGWEITINPPESAALITGMQWDKWMLGLMKSGLSDRAANGVSATETRDSVMGSGSKIPGVKTAVEALGNAVKSVEIDSAPTKLVEDSSIAFGKLAANMDMSVVGTMFYRERMHSMGSGEWSADATAALEKEWSDGQGSMGLTLSPNAARVVFGDDVELYRGRVVPGWKPGDRVKFIDGDTVVTELITGWEASWSGAAPEPVIKPIFGKRTATHTPVDVLVDEVKDAKRKAEKNSTLSPGEVEGRVAQFFDMAEPFGRD